MLWFGFVAGANNEKIQTKMQNTCQISIVQGTRNLEPSQVNPILLTIPRLRAPAHQKGTVYPRGLLLC